MQDRDQGYYIDAMIPFSLDTIAAYRADGSWGDRTIYIVFADIALAAPDRLAVIDAPNRTLFAWGAAQRLTYASLAAKVERLAACLWLAGLRPGNILLVQMPNVHELVALYLAAARVGIVMSPVPVQYRQGELQTILTKLRPDAFCSVTRCGKFDLVRLFQQRLDFAGLVLAFGEDVPDGVIDLGQALAGLDLDPVQVLAAAPPVSADSLFSVCWTSGTEGKPKGVPKTHNNWLCSSSHAMREGWLPMGGVLLAPFPLVNAAGIGGLMMSWLGASGTLVLHHPFDLEVFLTQIAAEKVAYTVVAPALLTSIAERLAENPAAYDLSSWRTVGCGSAPANTALLRRMEGLLGLHVLNLFGSNEGILLCSDRHTMPDPALRACVFPRIGDESWDPQSTTANRAKLRLVDPETGERVTTPQRAGELRIAGPSIFPGYYDGATLDRSGFDADGYFGTGDLFEIADGLTPDAALRFIGRCKELIIRGGMKIAPAELDGLIGTHPLIAEAAVAAWPDIRLGERVCAFIVTRPGATVDLDDICAHLDAAGVARFKWPERVVILDALPRNALAKVQRSALTKMLTAQ
jgi:acyl-CoA synthetase (AMP-forming)/AMP-acid ligase II